MTANNIIKSNENNIQDIMYLSKTIKYHLPELSQKYNINYLGVFGSYIRGEQKTGSDLDILIEFSKEPDLLEFVGLKQELSELLDVKVDLVMKNALKPRIGKRILEEVVQI